MLCLSFGGINRQDALDQQVRRLNDRQHLGGLRNFDLLGGVLASRDDAEPFCTRLRIAGGECVIAAD